MKFYDRKHVGRWSEGKQLFIKQADDTKLNKQVVAAMKISRKKKSLLKMPVHGKAKIAKLYIF